MIKRFPLAIKIQNNTYTLAHLSFNGNKKELFYFFPLDCSKIINAYNGKTWKQQRMDDHASFHKNGTVHIRHQNIDGRKNKRVIVRDIQNIFELPDDQYMPLLIHSFHFKNLNHGLTEFQTSLIDTEPLHKWELNDYKNFSLIPIVFGKKVHPNKILADLKFLDCAKNNLILIEPFKKHIVQPNPAKEFCGPNLLILLSNKATRRSPSEQIATDIIEMHEVLYSFGIGPSLNNLKALE